MEDRFDLGNEYLDFITSGNVSGTNFCLTSENITIILDTPTTSTTSLESLNTSTAWVHLDTIQSGTFTTSGSGNYFTDTTADFDSVVTTTLELPDPLIDWLPYKWKKYIPTWHLVRSYDCNIRR